MAVKGVECPQCRRTVRPGVQCRAFSCCWERKLGHTGVMVIKRPLTSLWKVESDQ